MSTFTPSRGDNTRIGRDILAVGRSIRVVAGLLLLIASVLSSVQFGGSPGTIGGIAAAFAVCVVGYTLVVWLLGERLFAGADPWLLAIALVAPTLVLFLFPA